MRHKGHQRFNKKRRFKRRYTLFQRISYFATHHPLSVGVLLIIASLILFRLSFTNNFLGSSEVFMWSIILSVGLFIAGLLTLVGWWRNHILQHRIGVKFGRW